MKKLKYLIGIIVICIVVFIGIEVFRKVEIEENNNFEDVNETNNMTNNTISTNSDILEENTNNTSEEETMIQNNETQTEIKNGQELLEKAEKTLTARGWAGASNNVIGIKDNIIYYYNKGTGEFRKIATGIEDIYYKTELAEEITAKKSNNAEILTEEFTFLIYE